MDIIEKALGKDHPSLAHVYYNLGMVYGKQGRLQQAETYFKKSLKINPDNKMVSKAVDQLNEERNSIEKNIQAGNLIIEALQEDGVDTAPHEEILANLEDLLDEVKQVDLDLEHEELAEQYSVLKAEAKEYSKDFRELVKGQISEGSKVQLKEEIKNKIKEINQGKVTQTVQARKVEQVPQDIVVEEYDDHN